MKLCWDNIENIILSKKGNFYDVIKKKTYYYNESCKACGESFLSINKNKFCSINCSSKKEHHMLGKKHSKETREKISNSNKGKFDNKASGWKGGYRKNNIPSYDTYAHQLEWIEEVRRNEQDPNILEVRCFKCGEWYVPKLNNVNQRIQILKSNYKGESRLYCSDQCKNSCSIYGKSPEQLMKEDAVRSGRLPWLELTREVQPELRQMVLERDEGKCVKCGSMENIQCHHIYPVSTNPLESADVDNCIILCYNCHKEVHKIDGCRYNQLKMEIC